MTRIPATLMCCGSLLLAACGSSPKDPVAAAKPQPSISVRTATATVGNVQTWLFGEGTARALKREFLSFESAGRIAYVDPNLKEGDPVVAGQLIAYQGKNRPSPGQGLSHAAVRDAEANLELAQKTYDRFALLLTQRSASQQEYDEAKAKLEQAKVAFQNANIVADESRIVAPINGVVARLNIEQGYYFSPQQIQSTSEAGALNTVPVVIIDPSAFEVSVSLPSPAYHQISVGAQVLFHQNPSGAGTGPAQGSPGSSAVQGVVYAVSPSVDPVTRTFSVKLRTVNNAHRMQDGEFVYAWIGGPSADNTLTLPIDSTRYENNQPYVFRVDMDTQLVARVPITLGLQGPDSRQILAGLAQGDVVVTEGRSRLANGDRVRVIGTDAVAENP